MASLVGVCSNPAVQLDDTAQLKGFAGKLTFCLLQLKKTPEDSCWKDMLKGRGSSWKSCVLKDLVWKRIGKQELNQGTYEIAQEILYTELRIAELLSRILFRTYLQTAFVHTHPQSSLFFIYQLPSCVLKHFNSSIFSSVSYKHVTEETVPLRLMQHTCLARSSHMQTCQLSSFRSIRYVSC